MVGHVHVRVHVREPLPSPPRGSRRARRIRPCRRLEPRPCRLRTSAGRRALEVPARGTEGGGELPWRVRRGYRYSNGVDSPTPRPLRGSIRRKGEEQRSHFFGPTTMSQWATYQWDHRVSDRFAFIDLPKITSRLRFGTRVFQILYIYHWRISRRFYSIIPIISCIISNTKRKIELPRTKNQRKKGKEGILFTDPDRASNWRAFSKRKRSRIRDRSWLYAETIPRSRYSGGPK